MNNKRKRTLKGFTLIELIIVMAIVSILMLGVMKVAQPAIKIMNNTSNSEKTYGYTDNIRTYLQTQLEYTDALWVIPENEFGANTFQSSRHKIFDTVKTPLVDCTLGSTIEEAVKQFTYENYFGLVTYNGSTSTDVMDQIQPLKGKVNVLRLCNHDHDSFKAGQITLTTYEFESYNNTSDYFASSGVKITDTSAEELAINPAYFEAYDTDDYTFSYALGAYDLVGDPSISGANPTDSFKVIQEDKLYPDINGDGTVDYKDDEFTAINNYNDLAVSIILGTGIVVDMPGSSTSYRAFQNPSQISVANIPLVNVGYFNGKAIGRMYASEEYEDPTTHAKVPQLIKWGEESVAAHPVTPQQDVRSFYAFPWLTPNSRISNREIDFDEDIFFIYSYATDLG